MLINWSDTAWDGPGFPTPADEAFIHRSPVNGPVEVLPGAPQWLEIYFTIPDYNPEWVSVDIWGDNILILESSPFAPPEASLLHDYWASPLSPGGIIVHECLPKSSMSRAVGPVPFKTICEAIPPFTEDFELSTFPPVCWTAVPVSGTYDWTRSTAASGYGTGTTSAFADFYSQAAGSTYDLTTFEFDISALTVPKLKFDHAYATFSGEVDTMNVYYSTDGGSSYLLLLAMPGGPDGILNTGGVVSGVFVPTADQWATQILSLPAGTNLVRFQAISNYGNNLYLDNISVFEPFAHDVACISIDNIPAVYDPTPIIPKVSVKNVGLNTETFDVSMTITGGYSSTKSVTSLASDATQVVEFDEWVPTKGNYTIQTYTILGADLDNSNDSVSQTTDVFNYTRFYCYIAYPGTSGLPAGPAYFYKEAPGTVNSLAPSTTNFMSGGTWTNGTWYVSEYWDPDESTGGGWYTVNPSTGNMNLFYDIERSYNGIAKNPSPIYDVFYGVDYDDVNLINNLYFCWPQYQLENLYASIGPGEVFINLATDTSDYLYSFGIETDHLYKFGPFGENFTDIGPTGLDLNYAQDMAYDYTSNTMYAAAYTTSGALYTVDLTTGACTLVGDFAGGAEITGLAIPYCNGIYEWTGNISNEWDVANNWSCGVVPGKDQEVLIPASASRFPVVVDGQSFDCLNLTIEDGASVTVDPGGSLNIINP